MNGGMRKQGMREGGNEKNQGMRFERMRGPGQEIIRRRE
jgi:hypothetical protein